MSVNPGIDASDPNGMIEGAIAAHARALHVFNVPSGQMAEMLRAAKSRLSGQGIRISELSASSSALLEAVQTSFAAVLGSFTEQQREAHREHQRDAFLAGTGVMFDALGRPMHGTALTMAAVRGQTGETGGMGGSSAKYDGSPGSAASITDPGFARALGISGATVRGLAALGFNHPHQIEALVKDANTLGINRDRGAMVLGGLKKANPAAYQGHVNFFHGDYRHSLEHVRGLERDYQNETDPVKKAEKKRVWDEGRKKHEELYQKHRAQAKKKEEKEKLDQLRKLMDNSKGLRSELGPDAARTMSSEERRANLSKTDRQHLENAERQQRKDSEAHLDTSVKTAIQSRWTVDAETAAASEPAKKKDDPKPKTARNDQPKAKPETEKTPTKPVVEARSAKPAGPSAV
jgi:hypothetical protein